jgi:hypothetical protein
MPIFGESSHAEVVMQIRRARRAVSNKDCWNPRESMKDGLGHSADALNTVQVPLTFDTSWWLPGWTVALDPGGMQPRTAISYAGPDGMPRGSIFGLSSDGRSLQETWLYQDNWNYFNHGGVPSSAMPILTMGPGSSIATAQTVGVADVLVVASGSDGNIWLQSTLNNHGWIWQSLGNPGWAGARTPILVAHGNDSSTRVHVFVAAPVVNGPVHLFERYADRNSSGYTWASWKDWGAAPPQVGFDLAAGVT